MTVSSSSVGSLVHSPRARLQPSRNSQPVADVDNNDAWSDYIYANGQKVAKAAAAKPMPHLRGTRHIPGFMSGGPTLAVIVMSGKDADSLRE